MDQTASELPQRIVLTGFMGAGKSTVGRLLARRLQWRFVDSDVEIEARAGSSIAEIFRREGEDWFRDLEHVTIRELLGTDQLVLALGGGAIEHAGTQSLLFQSDGTAVVHLEASLETVLRRCRGSEAVRPVLADKAHLDQRYNRRLPLYRQSHHTVGVDSLSPLAVVETVMRQIVRRPVA